jgi:hypothetical protein
VRERLKEDIREVVSEELEKMERISRRKIMNREMYAL